MSPIDTIGSRKLWTLIFVAAVAGLGLSACGGGSDAVVTPVGGGGGTVTPPPLVSAGTPIAVSTITNPGGGNTTLGAPNTFQTGDVVILAGTGSATLTGQTVVVAATPTTVTVPIPFDPAATATNATVAPTGGPVANCTTTGATGAITLAGLPSRISGVAPLAVFFDATTTTATSTTQPYHDLEYRWDFGDAGAGTWATGSRPGVSSKNTARGPMAAHVFETPGNYVITLTVVDGTNTVTNNCLQIGVGDPNVIFGGNKTTCVSSTGLPVAGAGGCPAGAAVVNNADFDAVLATRLGGGRRVLFKGGDTFTASIHTTYSGTGPAEVGAYGGGMPIVQWTGAPSVNGIFFIALTASDFRISGIEFDGQNLDGMFFMSFQNTAWNNLLLLNNYIHGWGGYLAPDWAASGGFGFYAFGNRIENPSPGMTSDMTLITGGSMAALVGNTYLMNGRGQQVVRMNNMKQFIVSDNTVSGAFGTVGNQKETIAMRSSDVRTGEFGVISGNNISVGPGYVGIFPSSANTNLGVFDVLIEGNYIFGASSGLETQAIHTNAERVTIRNNIIDATDPNMSIGILLRGTNGGFSLPSKDVKVYNNSIYSAKAAGGLGLRGVSVDTDVSTGNVVSNNLVYTSLIAGIAINDPGNSATKANNTGDALVTPGIVTLNPNWTITAPMTPLTNFRPGAGSYAIGKGAAVPVFSDFFGAARTGNDLGAVNP